MRVPKQNENKKKTHTHAHRKLEEKKNVLRQIQMLISRKRARKVSQAFFWRKREMATSYGVREHLYISSSVQDGKKMNKEGKQTKIGE
jgi:hypothetical protein